MAAPPITLQGEGPFWAYLDMRPWRELILEKAWADFRAQAINTYLGAFWWILDPLISMIIYYLVFDVFMNRGGPGFIAFLLVGIVTYRYFQALIDRSSAAIYKARNLIRQVAMPKIVFPIAAMLTQTYQLVFSIILLAAVVLAYGYGVSIHVVAVPFVLLVTFVLASGFALGLSGFVPFIPDLSNVVGYVLRIGFFMSGVMYEVDALGEQAQFFLNMNPLVHVIDAMRDCLMYHRWPDWGLLGLIGGLGLVGGLIGAAVIWWFDPVYGREMEE